MSKVLALLFALGVAGLAQAATFTGTVFEDANYGGGPGRSLAAANGVGIPNVRVELYRVDNGNPLDGDLTDANGVFSLSSGNNHVPVRIRVVNGSVRSTRTGVACTTCVAVQTFRTEGSTNNTVVPVTNRVGGENPLLVDGPTNGTNNANPSANFSTIAQTNVRVAQSVTVVDPTQNN